jgi:hypothetical protein
MKSNNKPSFKQILSNISPYNLLNLIEKAELVAIAVETGQA